MLRDFVDQDLIAEIDPEMVKENMPNYMAWTEKYSNIVSDDPLHLYAIDDKVYAIPDAMPNLTQFCLMGYRQDWLDNLGLPQPLSIPAASVTAIIIATTLRFIITSSPFVSLVLFVKDVLIFLLPKPLHS